MNERDYRETRVGGGVSDWGAATVSEPTQEFAGKTYATQSIQAGGERHLTRRQLENLRAAASVENVWSLKKTRKRLAVLAIADKAEAGGRRNRAGDAAQMTTTASDGNSAHLAFSIGCRQDIGPNQTSRSC
jgi:hypothetical protein